MSYINDALKKAQQEKDGHYGPYGGIISHPPGRPPRPSRRWALALAMAGIDALLTPSTMTTALPVAEVDQTRAPAHYTRFGNYLDLCALSLPNGLDPQGLPTSLQIVCRGEAEDMALRIGLAVV